MIDTVEDLRNDNVDPAYLVFNQMFEHQMTCLSICVFVCVLPNCASAFLYDPEIRWHDVPFPPHTPHLSTVLLLYNSPSHPTGCRTEIQIT